MPGRKGKFVGRQHLGPAMRLELAWPRTVAKSLEDFEDENPADPCSAGSSDGREALRAPVEQEHDAEPVPQPAVAHARGGDHPVANPPRGAPAGHAPHHAVVPPLVKSPDAACDGHRVTSKYDQKYLQGVNLPGSIPGANPAASADA